MTHLTNDYDKKQFSGVCMDCVESCVDTSAT